MFNWKYNVHQSSQALGGGEGDWTQVADSFFKSKTNKSLPFVGGALVLNWEGTSHVMFSYHEGFDISRE